MKKGEGHTLGFRSASEADTLVLGQSLGSRLDRGVCIAIVGPLGAGKTVLVRGICKGLGVVDEVLSPTFVLYEEFEGNRRVCHIDLYRLEHEQEIEELGVFDTLGSGAVLLVEWGDRSGMLMEASDIVVRLAIVDDAARDIEVRYTGALSSLFKTPL